MRAALPLLKFLLDFRVFHIKNLEFKVFEFCQSFLSFPEFSKVFFLFLHFLIRISKFPDFPFPRGTDLGRPGPAHGPRHGSRFSTSPSRLLLISSHFSPALLTSPRFHRLAPSGLGGSARCLGPSGVGPPASALRARCLVLRSQNLLLSFSRPLSVTPSVVVGCRLSVSVCPTVCDSLRLRL